MKKKIVSIVLCAVMALSALTGCGSDGKGAGADAGGELKGSSDGDYGEFITVDVYDELANYQGIQSGWFAKIIKDKFNMELNIIAPNVAGGGQTLYQTRSAAGDLGDLVIIDTQNGKLADLVSAGLLYDCTDLMKEKDIYKNYGAAINAMNQLVTEEGMWAFPNSVSSESAAEPSEGLEPTFGPYLRWDYYKAVGYPEMKTLNDFLDVLEQMQKAAREAEGNDNIYAISLFKDWDDNMLNNAKQFCCMYGFDEMGFVLAKADGSEYQSLVDPDSIYNEVLAFLYEANQRGLVDPDSTTQNYDTLSTKYTNGEVLYCPWPWLAQNQYNTEERKAEGKGFMMASIDDMQIFSYGNCPEGSTTRSISIGSKAEDPERLADFIDWLYSPEGIRLNAQSSGAAGIKGLTWDMVDGKASLTDFGKKALPMNEEEVPEEYGGGNWKDGVSALNFKPVNLGDIDPDTGEAYDYLLWETTVESNSTTELVKDWQAKMGADSTMEYVEKNNKIIVAPGSSYVAPEEDSNISTLRGQCKSTIVEYSWKSIFAKDKAEFDSMISTMRETVVGLGYEDVLAVDMKNAKDQNDARVASAEAYPAE